ncbi:MAG: GNAT family N-acetyltransferase [Myxococcales bacterium]|nr:GNAT family N-acetyltransferase [Myxococcales bacterium]
MTQPIRFSHKAFAELTLMELHDLFWLRNEVFVFYQKITAESEIDGRDPEAIHLLGRDADGRMVATARLFMDGDVVKVGRVAVHQDMHRSGLGTALMQYAHTVIGDRPAALSAQAYLRDWYERLGWQPVGDEYDEADIPHIYMKRPAQS